jgi:outer membrane protein TolC
MNYNTNFVASQTLYDWGKNKSTIDKILLETRLSQTQIDQTAFGLAFQIATVYHQVLFLQNVVAIQKAELGRINSHKAIVENQIKLGEALELDVMGLRIRVQNQETKITETETQIDKLIDFLQTQSGQKDLKSQIKAILQANSAKGAIDQNPTILSLEAEKSVFEQEIAIQSKASTPTLAGSASLGVRNGYLPRINGEVPAFEDDFKLNSLVGIKLTVPIYSGKRASMQQSLARIQQERIAFQKVDTQTKLSYEIRQGEANKRLIQNKIANAIDLDDIGELDLEELQEDLAYLKGNGSEIQSFIQLQENNTITESRFTALESSNDCDGHFDCLCEEATENVDHANKCCHE